MIELGRPSSLWEVPSRAGGLGLLKKKNRFVPSLIVGWYLVEACSFLKRMEEEWIRGKRNWKGVWEQWREGNLMSECNVSEKNLFKKANIWAMRNKSVAFLKVFAPVPHSLSLGLYHELLHWFLSIMDCNLQCEINPFLPQVVYDHGILSQKIKS